MAGFADNGDLWFVLTHHFSQDFTLDLDGVSGIQDFDVCARRLGDHHMMKCMGVVNLFQLNKDKDDILIDFTKCRGDQMDDDDCQIQIKMSALLVDLLSLLLQTQIHKHAYRNTQTYPPTYLIMYSKTVTHTLTPPHPHWSSQFPEQAYIQTRKNTTTNR